MSRVMLADGRDQPRSALMDRPWIAVTEQSLVKCCRISRQDMQDATTSRQGLYVQSLLLRSGLIAATLGLKSACQQPTCLWMDEVPIRNGAFQS